jgi:hypothetical protein
MLLRNFGTGRSALFLEGLDFGVSWSRHSFAHLGDVCGLLGMVIVGVVVVSVGGMMVGLRSSIF